MSAAMVITIGLPASGKTTWAEAVASLDPAGVVIVCRDDIRATLHPDTELKTREAAAARIRDKQIIAGLQDGKLVIVADTNLVPGVRRRLVALADWFEAPVQYKVFDVPLDECLRRNAARERVVPEEWVRNAHEEFIRTGRWTEGVPMRVRES